MENIKSDSLNGLRVCFIAGTLGVGGAERQLYLIISTLKRLGSEVSLICLNNGEYWESVIKETGINYYTLNGKGTRLKRLIKIIFLLRRIKPHIVQSQHFYTNIYVALGAFFCGAKSIGASRLNLEVEINEHNSIYGKMSFLLPQYFAMNSFESVEYGIKISRGKKRIFYLPNAVDDSKFIPQLGRKNSEVFTLLAMGRLESQKRFDKFIDMLGLLKRRHYDKVKGIIVGNGSLEDDLKRQGELLGLTSSDLEFVACTDSPQSLMHKSDIFILTSDFEGNPNVVLEAMACGLPVITTKVGNLPFFIKDREEGFFFDGSVNNLLEIVIDVMNEKEILNRVSNNAIQKINENFSIKSLELKMELIYKSIIEES
jgi:glycosyltransferase involved in cell wall biosynthesis